MLRLLQKGHTNKTPLGTSLATLSLPVLPKSLIETVNIITCLPAEVISLSPQKTPESVMSILSVDFDVEEMKK